MGIRIGGRVGPVSGSVGASDREITGCLGYIIGISLVVVIVISLAPIVLAGGLVWTMVQALRGPLRAWVGIAAGVLLVAEVVAMVVWAWPSFYGDWYAGLLALFSNEES